MNDLLVAEQLERQILGDRAVFPCGCVLECRVHYPSKDWAYTGFALHTCAEHPSSRIQARLSFDEGKTYVAGPPIFVGKFGRTPDHPDGPLERKWLKPDTTQVTLAELEEAMEENLDRLDQEQEEAIERAFRAARHVYHGIYQDHIVQPPPQFGRISRTDPHIVSQEGRHAIGRHGTVSAIPGRVRNQTMLHDEVIVEIEKPSFHPGDWIDLPKLQKEHTELKHLNFGLSYGVNMGAMVPKTIPNLFDAQIMQDMLLKTWPAFEKIGKGFQTDELVRLKSARIRVPCPIKGLAINGLWVDSEKRLEKDNPGLPHDTLPSTPLPPDHEGEKKEKE